MQNRQQELQWMQLDARRVTLNLSSADLGRIYAKLLRARLTDEHIARLHVRGLTAGSPSCRGHEAAQIGCVEPLHIGRDYILPYYRDLGVMAAIGMSPSALFLNQLGRRDDPISGGRMRPAQWNSRKFNVVSASGLIATQTLHAAGIAFAAKLRGEAAVAITFFGEGATSEGDFHEALNFAGVHQLGVIFVCENNGIALSTPQSQQMRAEHVADRAAGYGMPGVVVDGANVLAVIDAAREAFARARSGQGPTLLEIIVPRLPAPEAGSRKVRSQSGAGGAGTGPSGEPLGPVPEEDAEASEHLRDPVALFRAYLLSRGDLTPQSDQQLRDEIAARLDDAERKALAAAAPDPATVSEDLYADDTTAQPETAREEV